MKDNIGLAHPYVPDTGTGIKWANMGVELWRRGAMVARGTTTARTAWEFWHTLGFATAFPMVTHWGFRSIWTGRVRLWPSSAGPMMQGVAAWGWMAFDVADRTERIWMVGDGDPVIIDPPMPPNEDQAANLPLRLVLGRLIVGVIRDEIAPNQWIGVTSLVRTQDLEKALPDTHAAAAEIYGGRWRLALGDQVLDDPPRTALCRLLGLRPGA